MYSSNVKQKIFEQHLSSYWKFNEEWTINWKWSTAEKPIINR